jgi:hypothetical protein
MVKRLLFLITLFAFLSIATVGNARHRSHTRPVEVMTQNLYIGVDVFRLVGVPPEEIPIKASEVLAIVEQSNPPERMAAIAAEIARRRPHLIGLQEVYRIQTQTPGDFLLGNPVPAEDDLHDFLELLIASLETRGAYYNVASVVDNVDVELPAIAVGPAGPTLIDVRVRDRDVILVREDVEFANPSSGRYASHAVLPIGPGLPAFRGFASVDAWVGGRKYHFVNTHLEGASADPAMNHQANQTAELLGVLAAIEDPVIVVGDFNSGPQQEGVDTPYQQLAAAGYVDVWTARPGRVRAGYTCCHDEFLRERTPLLDSRIDLIWIRNTRLRSPVRTRTFGDRLRHRTPSGLWPSDHVGVFAWIRPVR